MAEPKTRPTKASVEAFLKAIPEAERRKDCLAIAKIMKDATKSPAKMWGPSIVGFGSQPLKYASGRQLDWPLAAFSPRKQALTIYGLGLTQHPDLAAKLGKYKTGKGCLYIKRLADIDVAVLKQLVVKSLAN